VDKPMTGLKYLINIYNLKISDLAEGLRIKESIVINWLAKVEKIHENCQNLLEIRFGVPKRYLIKEINDFDRYNIRKYILKRRIKPILTSRVTYGDDGKPVVVFGYTFDTSELDVIDFKIRKYLIKSRLNGLMKNFDKY
jgi:hypothetical protein